MTKKIRKHIILLESKQTESVENIINCIFLTDFICKPGACTLGFLSQKTVKRPQTERRIVEVIF